MGRRGIVLRSDVGSRTARALAVVLSSFALLLSGAADVLPRSAVVPLGASPAAAAAPASAQRLDAPSSSVVVRAAGLAAVPAPAAPVGGLPPSGNALVAPHLVADPQSRPPTSPPASSPSGSLSSRAPPGPAGT